ncbi:MAG: serine hydrolase [Deltaproteobacteria bacterium]|nr:serine hydrolase [Deltaproteobacteria bacterium]
MPAARHVQPEDGARVWRALDQTGRRGVAEGVAPGMVILVGNSREVLFHRAYGSRALVPTRLPMLPDTVFDVASLTKPIAATTAMMLLARDGRVVLDDPVSAVIPEFSEGPKSAVTFRQLLNHTSGLPGWKLYYEAVLAQIHAEPLEAAPGEKALYSDLGFILLGEAVERLTGKRLDRFCRDEIFTPLGLPSTFFVDLSPSSCGPRAASVHTVAATEDCPWRGKVLCGEVHDDNAFAMGGVAGHAGLFSSAPDIHRFLCFLGHCRDDAEPDFLPGAILREFLEAERPLPGQTHVLGWDTPSPEGSSSGRHFSPKTVGHLGFTGTSIWWDLERDVHVVLLTNRVHPSRDNDVIREFRPRVHDAAMDALFS